MGRAEAIRYGAIPVRASVTTGIGGRITVRNWRLGLVMSVWMAGAISYADLTTIEEILDGQRPAVVEVADALWYAAELGYLENASSKVLGDYLTSNGFSIERQSAGLPTAFVASAGRGSPVIAILAEFDALPGMSQAAVPEREVVVDKAAGHACGHNLFGAASVAAAVGLAKSLQTEGRSGTVRVYGTPAEEGGSGKVYMTRAGLFDDVDVVLHWHPSDRNNASPESTTANKSARFKFHGVASHAAGSPERGRSALDGVEAMNHMVNMMREHVPSQARIHYIITDGGAAPNIVPEFAEVYYYVRHPKPEQVVSLFERVVAAARGAALGTGTQMNYEVMHGNYPVLRNDVLARVLDRHMRTLGGIEYSGSERKFADKLYTSLIGPSLKIGSQREIQPFRFRQKMGSTDVGDVSWSVPTAGFSTATWVPGTPSHSWQAVAASGMSIGHKGMMLAAKVIALSGDELFRDPSLIRSARAEFVKNRGVDFDYQALLGDREPPLDYRK